MQIELVGQHIERDCLIEMAPDKQLDLLDHSAAQLHLIRFIQLLHQHAGIAGHTVNGQPVIVAEQNLLQHLIQLAVQIYAVPLHALQQSIQLDQTPDTYGLKLHHGHFLRADTLQCGFQLRNRAAALFGIGQDANQLPEYLLSFRQVLGKQGFYIFIPDHPPLLAGPMVAQGLSGLLIGFSQRADAVLELADSAGPLQPHLTGLFQDIHKVVGLRLIFAGNDCKQLIDIAVQQVRLRHNGHDLRPEKLLFLENLLLRQFTA